MKQFHSVLLCAALIFLAAAGCSPSQQSVQSPPEGTVFVDLRPFGKPILIPVPDTSTSRLSITENPDGSLTIVSGKGFGINVYDGYSNMDIKRSDIESDEVNRLGRFLKNDSTALFWESAITDPEYHFVINRFVHAGEYSFADAQPGTYSESEVARMMDCVAQAQ